jgi:hypothetical protein
MNTAPKERHGFTSFWLISGAIFNPIVCLIYLFAPDSMESLYNISGYGYRFYSGYAILAGLLMAAGTVAYIFLLSWKKAGFWLLVAVTISNNFLSVAIMGMNFILALFFSAISIAILWGILHIRKNGYTAWDHLNGNNSLEKNSNTNGFSIYPERACKKCGKTIPSGYSACQNCGYSYSSTIPNTDLGKISTLVQTKETVIICPYCKAELNISFDNSEMTVCPKCNKKIAKDNAIFS